MGREERGRRGDAKKVRWKFTLGNIGFSRLISVISLKFCRYTHYDENGHRIDERVSNERYTSQFDSDPVDSAFGNP